MRAVQFLLMSAGVLAITSVSPVNSFAQDEQAAVIKSKIESQNYTFTAQTVTPASGRTQQLTTIYTLKVSKDTVIADLPYFGRAYSAPINSTGGISFTSEKFDYTSSLNKKNRWQINIKPKDLNDVQELSLTIFNNGRADLSVISTNRQRISFSGFINEK